MWTKNQSKINFNKFDYIQYINLLNFQKYINDLILFLKHSFYTYGRSFYHSKLKIIKLNQKINSLKRGKCKPKDNSVSDGDVKDHICKNCRNDCIYGSLGWDDIIDAFADELLSFLRCGEVNSHFESLDSKVCDLSLRWQIDVDSELI